MSRSAAAIILIAASLVLTPFAAASAQQAGGTLARAGSRTEAPEPWRPAGPLHFLGLFPLGDGWFADPDSIRRVDDRAEVRLLTVNGRVRQVAEGDIRWTWSRVDIDCAGRTWETLEYDAYDTSNTWLAGFTGSIPGTNPVDVPSEEAVMAYACDGTRPTAFQSVPDQVVAVAGIMGAFAQE